MSNGELLQIEPLQLEFPFELQKQIKCSIQLTNNSDNHVAFKVKTTNPKKYFVRPNNGVVVPHSTCEVVVNMLAQKEPPPDMQCRDKFLLQSVVVSPESTPNAIPAEMFNKESGNRVVDQCMLTVKYVQPPLTTSPVQEGSEEVSSPRASFLHSGTVNETSEYKTISKGLVEPPEKAPSAQVQITRLVQEKRSINEQNEKLQEELKLLRQQRRRGRIPAMYVILITFVCILLGYVLKKP